MLTDEDPVQLMKRNLMVLVLLLGGCATPFLTVPGGALRGQESEAESFEFAAEYRLLQLETRPSNPYSVYLRVIVRDGHLYIDAAQRRRWHRYIQADNRVRIKIGDNIYKAVAEKVKPLEEAAGFISGRTIYRIVPYP